MKARNIFALLGLSFAMGVGAFAGVNVAQPKNVKAATNTTVYYAVSSSVVGEYDVKLNVNYKGDGDDWHQFDMALETDMFKGQDVYSCTFTDAYDGLGVLQFQLYEGDDWKSQIQPISSWTGVSNYNGKVWEHTGSAWETYTPDVAPEYHLLGTFTDPTWSDPNDKAVLTVDALDANHYTLDDVELSENDEVKVHDKNNDVWFGDNGANVVAPSDGTYDVDFYVRAANGVHVVLTKEVVEPVYTIVNRNLAPVTFVLDETDKPEGVKHQYSAQIQYACRGGELKFYADGVQITSNIGVDAGDAEHVNNVYGNTTDGFRIRHTYDYNHYTKIFLKTYEDGGYSIWGEGYDVDFFTATVKSAPDVGTQYNFVKDETYEPNETYIEQFKTSSAISIKALAGTEWATSNGLMCDGLSEELSPEDVAGNNAMQAFQGTAWKVHNDCEEVIYLKVKKTDLSVVMYIGGYVESHVVTIGGNDIPLTKFEQQGQHTQYRALNYLVVAGQTVSSYTIEGVAQDFTVKQIGNNNLTSDKKIIVTGNFDIYYDVVDSTLFISGMDFGGYHMIKNHGTTSSTFVHLTQGEDFEEFHQYYSASISFAVDDTIKFVDTNSASSLAVIWGITKINTGGLGENFVEIEGGIKCKTACSAAVYLKLKSGLDEVYFGNVSEAVEDAIDFAKEFVSSITTACEATESGRQAAVEAAWAAKATTYKAFDKAIKDALVEGSLSSVDEIRAFAAKYEAIFAKRGGEWDLEDFMSWHDHAPRVTPVENGNAVNSGTLIAVVSVIALVSVSSVAVLLVIKKRKHN